MVSEFFGVGLAFSGAHRLTVAEIQVIVVVPRKDVKMVMPDILSSSRFIMLSRRRAVTVIDLLECQRDRQRTFLDTRGQQHRNGVDIFIMLVRNNQDMSRILRPFVSTDKKP